MVRFGMVHYMVHYNGVREKEGSGTSPLNSVSVDGNLCPTEIKYNSSSNNNNKKNNKNHLII